jgi:tyrosinase
MSAVRVRQDVWELGDSTDPWRDPALLAYARAVASMKELAQSEPENGANWTNQAAIHEKRGQSIRGRLEDQCQHASWFFLPWHRMYLYWFEQILRAQLEDDQDWALPYWNYTNSTVEGSQSLPPAFREQHLPDGKDNPLFIKERQVSPIDVNGGKPLNPTAVETAVAMGETVFSRSAVGTTNGFGGSRTNPLFHHSAEGRGAGELEVVPHGTVHVEVGGKGGFMTRFSTAALDPIFWLHHANLDRLWEEWLRDPGSEQPPGLNPTDPDWLGMEFDFVDANGQPLKMVVNKVLDIEAQLDYTYSHLPAPAPAAPAEMAMTAEANPEHPPEMVGSSDGSVTLAGTTIATSLAVSPPSGPAGLAAEGVGGPAATYLNIENVSGEANPGLLYGVYMNLPEGEAAEPDNPHFVGTISLFGIESSQLDDEKEEAHHGLHYVFDVSKQVERQQGEGKWDPKSLRVTFSPVGVSAEDEASLSVPSVVVGQVSLFVE